METAKQIFGIKLFQFVFLTFLAVSVSGLKSSCTNRQHTFYAAENRALEGQTYDQKTVNSHVICGRECVMDDRCKSFNFNYCNKTCELNLSTRREYPGSLNATLTSSYFDGEEDTPFYSAESFLNQYRSCKTLLDAGYQSSGIYTIYLAGFGDCGLRVYCDMDTDGGGWIVFQRRQDGSVDFWRSWADYRSGFGNLSGEFWLGNDNLVTLTSGSCKTWELRVDLEDWEGNTVWAKYTDFKLTLDEYRLTYGLYDVDSTAGDSLAYSKGWGFTTIDKDNDGWPWNCASYHKGAWWFNGSHVQHCVKPHRNGNYYPDGQKPAEDWGILWFHWKGTHDYSLKKCSMKIREM